MTKRAQELGVPIAAGTDGMIAPGAPLPALHDEMATLVKAGLTPMQALVAATGGR